MNSKQILDATGQPITPPDPKDIIYRGGVDAVNLFMAAAGQAIQYQQAAQAMANEAGVYRVLTSCLAGMLGGGVMITAELDKACRELNPKICVQRNEDGSWQLWLAHVPEGRQFDPSADPVIDLSGHLVACRAALKAAHAAQGKAGS